VKDGLIELVLLAVILNPSLDLLLRETIQNLIVLQRQPKFVQDFLVLTSFFLITKEDLQALLFVYEEGLLAMQADEGEADIARCLIHPLDYVVHFGILVIHIPGLCNLPDLLLNVLDGHPIDAILAARCPLNPDVLLDND